MIRVCGPCSETEKIPTIKKPSMRQLEKADERYSVRERMENMSGYRDKTDVSEEQIVLQGKLANLRAPPRKQSREDIEEDYSWNITMARRRRKMSTTGIANEIGIDPNLIAGLERGRIPENYAEVLRKLEKFLQIKLLKSQEQEISFKRNLVIDEEDEILKRVQERIDSGETDYEDNEGWVEEKEEPARLPVEDNKGDVTIDSLLRRKRAQEKQANKGRPKMSTDAMLGDEIELDIDEL